MITVAAGVRTTLVASPRPPTPTSSKVASAGWRAKSRKVARHRDLEETDLAARVDPLATFERLDELVLPHELAGRALRPSRIRS